MVSVCAREWEEDNAENAAARQSANTHLDGMQDFGSKCPRAFLVRPSPEPYTLNLNAESS